MRRPITEDVVGMGMLRQIPCVQLSAERIRIEPVDP